MNRFQKTHVGRRILGKLIPVALFIGILLIFLSGLSSVSDITREKEAESLQKAVIQSAVQCYALEGFYPDSLSYLEEHYGLQYNESRYLISYEVIGSNLMPDVQVIPLDGGKEKKP